MATDYRSGISVLPEPSFIRLVFSFALDPERGSDGLDEVKRRANAAGWADRRILYEYVLPHLADHLNAPAGRSDQEVGHWWTCERTLPLQWEMRISTSRCVPLVLNSVEFLMFRTGVGMLILDIDVASSRLSDWEDALAYSRFYRLASNPACDGSGDESKAGLYRDQSRHGIFASRSVRIHPVGEEASVGGKAARAGFGWLISDLLMELFGGSQWERPSIPGLLIPYSAFFVDWNEAGESERFGAQYRWRRQLQSRATVSASAHDDLNATLRTYGKDMVLAYSVDGGGFFAGDLPDTHFFQHELPEHLRRPYSFGFLLALHERLALSRFSERIARAVADAAGSLPDRIQIASLQDEFLEFQTRCRFVQILRSANHHTNYREWENAFEVGAFSDEVEKELRGLFERAVVGEQILESERVRMDAIRSRRVSRRANAAVLGISFPAVVLAALGVSYPDGVPIAVSLGTAIGSALLGIALGLLADRFRPVGVDDIPTEPSA